MSATARPPKLRAVLIGAGHWGKNFLRVLAAHPEIEVACVVDPSEAARERAATVAKVTASLDEALESRADLAVIASPAELHAEHARRAIDAGLHVLVEKPLATSTRDAEELVARARAKGVVAMVGHLLLHHPAVKRVLELSRRGALGPLRYMASSRLSPTTRASSTSVLWSLGPHDLAVLHALDPSPLRAARSLVLARDSRRVIVAAGVHASLESGFSAHLELSSVHAFKERRVMVVGEEAVVIFDDLLDEARLRLARVPRGATSPDDVLSSLSDARVVPIEMREPLAEEVDDLVRAIREGRETRTPIEQGALVVRWLEEAERAAD